MPRTTNSGAGYKQVQSRRTSRHNFTPNSPEERAEYNKISAIVWGIVIILGLTMFFLITATKAPDEEMVWMK